MNMETKVLETYTYNGFGFPVVIKNATFAYILDDWLLHINHRELEETVLRLLAHSNARLTGKQVRFIRDIFMMTLQQFADRFDVTHPAVIKWESTGNKPTGMNWATEKDIRLAVISRLNDDSAIGPAYRELESKPTKTEQHIEIEALTDTTEHSKLQ